MSRPSRVLVVAPLAAALAGCPATSLVMPADDSVDLQFEAVAAGHGQWLEEPEISVLGLDGGLLVKARMSTADPCRAFEASANRSGGRVILSIRVEPNSEGCHAVVGTFRYTAVLSALPPGTHRFTITHVLAKTGDPGPHTVFDGEVLVR